MQGIKGSAAGGIRGQDPYREATPTGVMPYQFRPTGGRHSSNPNAVGSKNLQYIQKYRTSGPSP